MINVIGKVVVATKVVTCSVCGSVLEFTLDEVKTKNFVGYLYDFVECPTCGNKVSVKVLQGEVK